MNVGDILSILMFIAFIALIFTGFPVAWVLDGPGGQCWLIASFQHLRQA